MRRLPPSPAPPRANELPIRGVRATYPGSASYLSGEFELPIRGENPAVRRGLPSFRRAPIPIPIEGGGGERAAPPPDREEIAAAVAIRPRFARRVHRRGAVAPRGWPGSYLSGESPARMDSKPYAAALARGVSIGPARRKRRRAGRGWRRRAYPPGAVPRERPQGCSAGGSVAAPLKPHMQPPRPIERLHPRRTRALCERTGAKRGFKARKAKAGARGMRGRRVHHDSGPAPRMLAPSKPSATRRSRPSIPRRRAPASMRTFAVLGFLDKAGGAARPARRRSPRRPRFVAAAAPGS